MTQDRNERRQRIMNSDKTLPGDPQRAAAEENEDFDAPDSGNFDTRTEGRTKGNPARRQQINQSEDVLPGDAQRAADDKNVDKEGPDAPRPRR